MTSVTIPTLMTERLILRAAKPADFDAEMQRGRALVEGPPQHAGDGAGLLMVGRHAEAHQAEGLVQPLEHVDDRAGHGPGERVRQIAARRAGPDDGETRRQCSFTYS